MWWVKRCFNLAWKDDVPFAYEVSNQSDRSVCPCVSMDEMEEGVTGSSEVSCGSDGWEVDEMDGACCKERLDMERVHASGSKQGEVFGEEIRDGGGSLTADICRRDIGGLRKAGTKKWSEEEKDSCLVVHAMTR